MLLSNIPARFLVLILGLISGLAISAQALDWSAPEQELASKIIALAGSGTISLSFENRSSLGRRDAEIIRNGLRSALATMGVHVVQNDPAATTVAITLSENQTSYVWVAQVQKVVGAASVVMVAVGRPANANAAQERVPLSLRKLPLWNQAEPILDVAVLEENGGPTRIAVLSPDKVSLYRIRGGSSQLEAASDIAHSKPWPRDLRGRVVPGKGRTLDIHLPGVVCHGQTSGPPALNCHEANEPWPLLIADGPGASANSSASVQGFFEASRNFFISVVTTSGVELKTVPQFYSAAVIPREKDRSWLFAAVDGKIHILDDTADRAAKLSWGSEITSVRTSCGAGWHVLATSANRDGTDSIRAYEIPDRDPVAVSVGVDFPGPVSALWAEAKGDTAIAISQNAETGNYEAFRLAVACGQ